MHHLSLATAKTVYLSTLKNGEVFIANADGGGHVTGVVFSDHGVLVLTGPDRFKAIEIRGTDRTPVVRCSDRTALELRVPSVHSGKKAGEPHAGRIIVDDRGLHLTFRWRNMGEDASGFSSLSLSTWKHGGVPSGIELDAWSLVRVDDHGTDVPLVTFPG
ncbi:hypothetical protein FIV34_11645 [Luteibacter pinisoli]|uniref:Uncharacterized protein n=1 Tax=Luteibacter pinisoli TaxID=2589080 RepID=A0A4Y5Z402_9GAMM|nr:hypothetical protein [Luteibacter pinisoli]QDE39814.1 hypothetical protein FIV34_11645 [Luteibacter pinisoli]